MDIKIECERINILCHGCLTQNRKVRRISGEISEIFFVLRNDTKLDKQRHKLILCWECVAFLEKLKMFQARIKTAQCLLSHYLQCYYKNESLCNPESLSTLNKIHTNTYNFEFYEEDKVDDDIHNNINSTPEDKVDKKDFTSEELLTEIKLEYSETIKEEFNGTNEDDSDYYESVLKIEQQESADKSPKPKDNSANVRRYKCKNYGMLATVTRRKDFIKKNYLYYAEPISLDKREYEMLLKRDKICYGYHRKPFKCEECKMGYLKHLDLQRHHSYCHSDKLVFPYKCAGCPTMLTSQEHQDQHWADAHSKVYKCTICSEIHLSNLEVKKHIKMFHTKNYACKSCGLEFGSLRDFRNHYKSMHERMVCDYCNMDFTKKKSLVSHMKCFHIPAFCKICNRMYTNHKTFKYHNQVTHPELMAGETRKELSYCVECDKQYPSVHKYRKHLQQSPRHTQQKKLRVPCPDCGKIFTRTNFMRNHYRFVHLKVTKHYCEQCDKYYTTGYGLRKHIETVHEKIAQPKDKMCDLCGRGFTTNKILQNHRRTHTGERPFKCQYCPAAFAQQTAMKTHQKSQHKTLDMSS